MANIDQLYTIQSVGTFAGASGLVLVISKMIGRLTPLPAAPIAAVVALLVSVAGALQAGTPISLPLIVVVAGNTALLFSAATGFNETIAAGAKPKELGTSAPQAAAVRDRTWLSSWFS